MTVKVREHHRVIYRRCHIALGVSEAGNRELSGFMIQDGESKYIWTKLGMRTETWT